MGHFIYRTGLLLADILPRDLVGQAGTGGVLDRSGVLTVDKGLAIC